MQTPFEISNVQQKISTFRNNWPEYFKLDPEAIPVEALRDVQVVKVKELPEKLGLSFVEGQARLLHDLASIELQAMELALRGVIEFPNAPEEFREELMKLALNEASHLELCLNTIEKLGYRWGHWPVHNGLWQTVQTSDELLDRILIVHCYLEGSGLDAGDSLLKRLYGLGESLTHQSVQLIMKEEVDHVRFGLEWFEKICRLEKRDPQVEFQTRLEKIKNQLPRRIEPISYALRKKAGFQDYQIEEILKIRNQGKPVIRSRQKVENPDLPELHLLGILS